jgi:glycogen(starch) synthase
MMPDSLFPNRILMTADAIGGVWTYALELAQGLSQHGVQVAIACMGGELTPIQQQAVQTIPNLTLFESGFKLEWMDDPWQELAQAGDWLLALEQQLQPDVVHLNGYVHGALPWRSPTLIVAHSCVLSWWQAVKGAAAPPSWDHYRHQVRQGLQAADRIVSPSAAMLRSLQIHYDPQLTGQVIWNGRSPAQFTPQPAQPLILTVGRLWDEAKNIAALDAIAPDLPWPVYAAGEPQHVNGHTVALEGIQPLGQLPAADLKPWLERAAIYALPARYEPFGLSALEAGLAGCALVLGDIPSLREIWGEAALFVPPADCDRLRATLQTLIQDVDQRQWLAQQAHQRALQLTAERMIDQYLAVYADLMVADQAATKAFSLEKEELICGL